MHGVVSAGSVQSVDAAAEVFRAGGGALDAVIAGAFATSSGEGAIASLAGGGVLTYRDGRTGEVEVCDFFANAPGLSGTREVEGESRGQISPLDFLPLEVDFGAARQIFHVGRGAAAVPGAIPGLLAAWRRRGRCPLATILEPTVRMLRDGIVLGDFQSHCVFLLRSILCRSPTGRRRFFDDDGDPLPVGAVFRNPDLATMLERLSRGDPEAFYGGELRDTILDGFGESRGGWLTRDDLRSYSPVFRSPLVVAYGNGEIATNPAPAVGGRFIARTVELMEAVNLREVPAGSPERYERLAAVFRAVAELRSELPDLVENPDASRLLRERVGTVLEGRTGSDAPGVPELPGNTVHVSAVDAAGNAAGVTLSHGEGNGHDIEATGILMNNFLGEEDLFPGGFHRFTPGERLGTMMAPTVLRGPRDETFVLGSGGSSRIRTAMTQVISGILDDGLDPGDAVERPRLHFEGGVLSAETFSLAPGDALDRARKLARRCDLFDRPSLFFGGVNIAWQDGDGTLGGTADSRRGGAVRIV